MTTTAIRQLARDLAALKQQVRSLSTQPQLAYSSIEGGAVSSYGNDDSLGMVVGVLPDGTQGALPVNGPPPPQPSAPIVAPAPRGFTVTWDGNNADGSDIQPLNWGRMTVHVSRSSPSFTPTPATARGTIETPMGGTYTYIAGDEYVPGVTGDYYVKLVAVSTAGVFSAASAAASIQVGTVQHYDLHFDAIDGMTINGVTINLHSTDPNNGAAATTTLDSNGMQVVNGYGITVVRFSNGAFQIGNVLRGFSPGVVFSDNNGLESWVRNPQNPTNRPFDSSDPTTFPIRAFWLDPATGQVSLTGSITADTFSAGTGTTPNYVTNFSSETTGLEVPSWAIRTLPATGWSALVQADATNAGGKVLQVAKASGAADGSMLLGPSAETDLTNGEILGTVKWNRDSSFVSTMYVAAARATPQDTSGGALQAGYTLTRSTSNTWRVERWSAGVPTTIGTITFATALNTYVSYRFRVQGTTISVKIWAASSPEPAAWTKTLTDTAITSSGFWGLGMNGFNSATFPEQMTMSVAKFNVTALSSAFVVDSTGNVLVGGESTTLAPFSVTPAGKVTASEVQVGGKSLSRGALASITGPGIQTDVSTLANVVTMSPLWVSGRTYLIVARIEGASQITAAANVVITMAASGGAGNPQTLIDETASPVGAKYNGTAAYLWTCNNAAATISVTASSSAGAVRIPPSSVQLFAIDMGV